MGWHERVHRHLGEVLCYFFVKVSPLDSGVIKSKFEDLLKRRGLGSVRVFEVYGAYDLIVRAWLHRTLVKDFDLWLAESLSGMVKIVHQFEVTDSDIRWYQDLPQHALQQVDESTVREAQGVGRDLSSLIFEKKLITQKDSTGPRIRFFVSVYFEGVGKELYASDGKTTALKVKDYLASNQSLQHCTIDRGFGFCSMLIKGECNPKDYFDIAKLPNWISLNLGGWRVTTETFLVHSAKPLVGHEMIGRATFEAMKGKNLFAYSVLPELDDPTFGGKNRHSAEVFLAKVQSHSAQLSPRDRRLLRNCLMAYMDESIADYGKALYGLFAGVENYLRQTHLNLFNRLGVSRDAVFDASTQPPSSKRHIVLGDLFKALSRASSLVRNDSLSYSGFEQFAELRNATMHGDLQGIDLDRFAAFLGALPGLRRTISEVEKITQIAYNGD